MRVLVTGTAGFIGFHLARRLLADGHTVIGIDGVTPYYDQALKRRRHQLLTETNRFTAHELMLEDAARVAECVAQASADLVFHLAAQPGVRYSSENPRSYFDSNVLGTFNLLEALRKHACGHLLFASTSSVYGASSKQPFEEQDRVDRPLSLYAATKLAGEHLAFDHAHSHRLPTTVVRLFTVYGPWGRPDMALFKFTKNILSGDPIDVYGHGKMLRDFTYVSDVVEGLCRLAQKPPEMPADASVGAAPFQVVNIGSGRPIELEAFITTIEEATGRKAVRRYTSIQPGEAPATHASTAVLQRLTGYRPTTSLKDGVQAFVDWYRVYTST